MCAIRFAIASSIAYSVTSLLLLYNFNFHADPEVKSVEGDEKKSAVQEPEDMEAEETKQTVTALADSRKGVERKDLKSNVTTSSSSNPKPAKRRITPMSIDQS